MPPHPNIILITADSLRADHLGCYGYARDTSPNIDRLAGASIQFTHVFSDGPNTPHAFPAIMASRPALASKRLGLFDAPDTLAEILKAVGYQTLGFNSANPYVSRFFQYHRGFDHFRDYLDLPASSSNARAETSRNGAGKPQSSHHADAILSVPKLDLRNYVLSEENSRSKAILESTINEEIIDRIPRQPEQPFFLWVHYMDTHYPYLPQRQAQLRLGVTPIEREENLRLNRMVRESSVTSSAALKKIVNLYDASVRQLDDKIGQVLNFLRQTGLYDSSLLVFTADHGEEFMEHGDLQHKSKLYDELLHVPLLVKLPETDKGSVRNDLASLIQLAPTILSSAGVDNPFEHESLFGHQSENSQSDVSGIFASASYGPNGHAPVDEGLLNIDPLPKTLCYRTRRWKVMLDRAGPGSKLFNLITDAREHKNVANRRPQENQRLQALLEAYAWELEKTRLRTQVARVRRKLLED